MWPSFSALDRGAFESVRVGREQTAFVLGGGTEFSFVRNWTEVYSSSLWACVVSAVFEGSTHSRIQTQLLEGVFLCHRISVFGWNSAETRCASRRWETPMTARRDFVFTVGSGACAQVSVFNRCYGEETMAVPPAKPGRIGTAACGFRLVSCVAVAVICASLYPFGFSFLSVLSSFVFLRFALYLFLPLVFFCAQCLTGFLLKRKTTV